MDFLCKCTDLAEDHGEILNDYDEEEELELCTQEKESLIYLSGYVSRSITQEYKLCHTCKDSLVVRRSQAPPLIAFKSYVKADKTPLFIPSDSVVQLLQSAEHCFRSHEGATEEYAPNQ